MQEQAAPRAERQPRNRGRYRNASELGTFQFCQRAWTFERQGTPSAREPERAAGTAYHRQHGERVDAAKGTNGLARIILLIAVLLMAAALLMSL